MSLLQEFRDYVTNSDVDFNTLSVEQKLMWRQAFDKSRQAQPGNYFKSFEFIEPFPSHFSYLYFIFCF
jgi:hypothetical protein